MTSSCVQKSRCVRWDPWSNVWRQIHIKSTQWHWRPNVSLVVKGNQMSAVAEWATGQLQQSVTSPRGTGGRKTRSGCRITTKMNLDMFTCPVRTRAKDAKRHTHCIPRACITYSHSSGLLFTNEYHFDSDRRRFTLEAISCVSSSFVVRPEAWSVKFCLSSLIRQMIPTCLGRLVEREDLEFHYTMNVPKSKKFRNWKEQYSAQVQMKKDLHTSGAAGWDSKFSCRLRDWMHWFTQAVRVAVKSLLARQQHLWLWWDLYALLALSHALHQHSSLGSEHAASKIVR